jgi:glycosyltransferase involved in cell wall biosynthesis
MNNALKKPQISCIIGTYNEEARIARALRHATQWANEVLVIDKSSTDATATIARDMGAKVVTVPFSRQGHEDVISTSAIPTHDWIFFFTPSEVPTQKLIAAMKAAAANDIHAVICVPVLFWSFGINSPNSTWHNCHQPRAYHRRRAVITNTTHANFGCYQNQRVFVPFAEDCFLIHQTHPNAPEFIRSHVDYIAAEARTADLETKLAEARHNIACNDAAFAADPSIEIHKHAWKFYWHGVALSCLDALRRRNVPAEYADRAQIMLNNEWPKRPLTEAL